LVPQGKKVVIVCPLILLRGAPEEMKGGKCEAAGGLSSLEIDVSEVVHRKDPYTLLFWEPRRRRRSVMKSLQFSVV
jgi:hypothetical protein